MTDEPKKLEKDVVAEAKETVKIATDQALIELEALKVEYKALQTENDALKVELGKSNGLLDAQLRSKLVTEVKSISKLSNEQLARMTTGELQDFIETYKNTLLPHKKPITFTSDAEDTEHDSPLSSLFAFKRK